MVDKDQHGKTLNREFAPGKRPNTEDLTRVVVVPKEPDYDVTIEDQKIKVTKRQKDD